MKPESISNKMSIYYVRFELLTIVVMSSKIIKTFAFFSDTIKIFYFIRKSL